MPTVTIWRLKNLNLHSARFLSSCEGDRRLWGRNDSAEAMLTNKETGCQLCKRAGKHPTRLQYEPAPTFGHHLPVHLQQRGGLRIPARSAHDRSLTAMSRRRPKAAEHLGRLTRCRAGPVTPPKALGRFQRHKRRLQIPDSGLKL